MPSINTTGSGHAAPAAIAGWQWLPYSNVGWLSTLRKAIHIIDTRIKGNQPCNAAFSALPSGRTFAHVWADPTIWISFDPDRTGRYGATNRVGGKEITITEYALAMGVWTVAATLIHELAHTNGAPSGNSHAAEATLGKCLLRNLEINTILGKLEQSKRFGGLGIA
jgi:hypothetical protein